MSQTLVYTHIYTRDYTIDYTQVVKFLNSAASLNIRYVIWKLNDHQGYVQAQIYTMAVWAITIGRKSERLLILSLVWLEFGVFGMRRLQPHKTEKLFGELLARTPTATTSQLVVASSPKI